MANEGPCEKICNGFCAMICGIILWPIALGLLGWNESRYVCEQKRILYAETNAKEIGCSNMPLRGKQDTFAYFSCPFVTSTILTVNQCSWDYGSDGLTVGWEEESGLARALGADPASSSTSGDCSSLPKVNFTAVSAERRVQILQCVEKCSNNTSEDAVGREGDDKDCSYSLEWSEKSISTDTFWDKSLARSQCKLPANGSNPLPPSWLSLGANTIFANRPVVGETSQSDPSTGFKLNNGLAQQLTPTASAVDHYLEPPNWRYVIQCYAVGCMRLRYYKSPATSPSVFTKVTGGLSGYGVTTMQEMPGAWGCTATVWQAIFADHMEKSEAIAELHAANSSLAWVLRILGLSLTIISILLCLSPIAAAADVAGSCCSFIPCGRYFQELIEGLTCLILCPISTACGCACGLSVMLFMWLFMRPVLASAGFLLVGLLCVAAGMLHRKGRGARTFSQNPDLEMPVNAGQLSAAAAAPAATRLAPGQPAVAVAQAVPVAVPPPAPRRTMMVACPEGSGPGSLVQVVTPDGQQMQVAVPAGMGPGMEFQVQY